MCIIFVMTFEISYRISFLNAFIYFEYGCHGTHMLITGPLVGLDFPIPSSTF